MGLPGLIKKFLTMQKKRRSKLVIPKKYLIIQLHLPHLVSYFVYLEEFIYLYYLKKNNFGRNLYDKFYHKMNDVFEKKILFVGYGNIAKNIAKVCKSMNMRIFKVRRKTIKKTSNTFGIKNLNQAVIDKDFIINLLPYTLHTKEIFNLSIFLKK